jgi:nitrate reductase NapD
MSATACSTATCGCHDVAADRREVHIAGVWVQVRPEHVEDVSVAVSLLPRAEVTHKVPDGRVIAVLEAGSGREVAQQIEAIRILPGVVNVALVYQHAEDEEDLGKEMQP